MSDDKIDDEPVPQVISDKFFDSIKQDVHAVVKDLREKAEYRVAREFFRLLSTAENLQLNLKDEQTKVQELTDQHVNTSGRIEEAMKISQRDQGTITKLREEVVEAWKFTDASNIREIATSEKFDELKRKFESTQKLLQQFFQRIDTDSDQLSQHKVTVLQECERLTAEVGELHKRLTLNRVFSDEVQKKLEESLEKNRELYTQWDEATNDSLSNKRKAETMKERVDSLTDKLEQLTESMLSLKTKTEAQRSKIEELKSQLKTKIDELLKAREDIENLEAAKAKLKKNVHRCTAEYSQAKLEMDQAKRFMHMKEDENRKLVTEGEHNLKKIEGLMRKLAGVQEVASKLEYEIQTQGNLIVTTEKEREAVKRANDIMKKENDGLAKKVENSRREIEKRDEFAANLGAEKQKLAELKMLVEKDLKSSKDREKTLEQTIRNYQTKLDTVEAEKSYLEESMKELSSEIDARDQQIENLKTQMLETSGQLSHFKHEFNLSVNRLKEAKAMFQMCHEKEAEIRDRYMKCKLQVENTNSNLTRKIAEVVGLLKKMKKLEKKNRDLKRDFEGCRMVLKQAQEELKMLRLESKNQKEALRENDARFVTMKSQAEKILRERDLIANQMVRRTDESELLIREVTTLKTSIERGNGKYNDRLSDIKLMKNEIKSLRSQCNILKRALENTADMRHEVLKLHRQLNQERVKAKILEQEMITPMNVHRWRKLNTFDSKRSEMLKKCQRLQRSALMASTRIAKSEEVIQALQVKIELLEKEINRRPGLAVHEKLMVTRSQLTSNTKRMKAAIALSRASEHDLESKDKTIVDLRKELNEAKSQFFKIKSEKSKLMEKMRELTKHSGNDGTKET